MLTLRIVSVCEQNVFTGGGSRKILCFNHGGRVKVFVK